MNLPFLLTLELVFWCVTVLLIIVPLCAPRNDPLTGADLGHAYTEFTDKNFDNVKALNTMPNTLCIMEKEFCDIMFNSIEILPLMDIFTVGLGMVLVSSRAPRFSSSSPLTSFLFLSDASSIELSPNILCLGGRKNSREFSTAAGDEEVNDFLFC